MSWFESRALARLILWRLFCLVGIPLGFALILWGCATLPAARGVSTDRCRELEASYRFWGGLSAASAAIAGSGALSTAFPEDKGIRVGFGIASAGVTALGAAALFVRDDVLETWSEECPEENPKTIITVETSTVGG